MRTIILSVLVALLTITAVDRILSFVFREAIFKKTLSGESGGTINYTISRKKDVDFLIMGASRAKHSLDPELIPTLGTHGYNIGINGTNALNSMLILDILLRQGVSPKTIVFQTDLRDHLASTTDPTPKLVNQIKRVYHYDTPLIRTYVQDIGVQEEIKYFFDLYKLNGKIINLSYNFLKRNSIGDNNGYVGLPATPYHQDPESADGYVFYNTGTNAQAIRDIKALCDKHGIQLVLVLMPSYDNIIYNKKETVRMIETLRSEGITTIVDLSDISLIPELNNESLWRDGVHMNNKGATVFSKHFNQKLLELKKQGSITLKQ